ncbi:MAG: diacylglycerol kinase family lipid kinase, partial [Dehalococcoidales bacterium]|nr:diacylglycerol kinase family lipid kinase [Dehalococcoidales bacterium]
GTACSFVRSVGISRDYTRACSLLTSPRRLLIDVGVIEYRSKGQSLQRFFINVAGVGFDAAVVEAVKHLPKYFIGTIPYIIELPRTLFNYQSKSVVLHLGNKVEATYILSVEVANGSYFGGGMHMAPQAKLNDGLLDVVIIGDIGKFELLRALPTVYKGTHIIHPKVRVEKATHIAIESSERVLVHADGELVGEGPVSFRLVPAALSIVVG